MAEGKKDFRASRSRFAGGADSRVLVAFALFAAGCVERRLVIESEPSGARVWVNGVQAGETPARVRFHHYGHYRIVLRKPWFEKLETVEGVRRPWYQCFPLDFVAEFLWPGRILDERRFSYRLSPAARPEPDALLKRARERLKDLPPAAPEAATASPR